MLVAQGVLMHYAWHDAFITKCHAHLQLCYTPPREEHIQNVREETCRHAEGWCREGIGRWGKPITQLPQLSVATEGTIIAPSCTSRHYVGIDDDFDVMMMS